MNNYGASDSLIVGFDLSKTGGQSGFVSCTV